MRPQAFAGMLITSLIALGAAASAQAYTYCVSSATGLQNALDDVSDSGTHIAENNTIQVVTGTYQTGAATGNQAFHYQNTGFGSLNLEGGWNAGCTIRTQKAARTILDGHGATQVLSLRQARSELDVTAFTIENGKAVGTAGGLSINSGSGYNSRVVVSGNIIRGNQATGTNGGLDLSSGTANAYLTNNVIVGNSSDSGSGAGTMIAHGGSVYNNTIVNNATMSASTGGLVYADSGNGFIIHNIFRNNTGYGIFLASGNDMLSYNDYDSRGGIPPASSSNNFSQDPLFANAAAGDFHLAGYSLLLGVTQDPEIAAIDPDGNAYPHSGNGDIGAYNETVFKDGFYQ